ncbi:phosphotransferase enzyme family protein [Mucilaginibacter sp. BT774]|uniref:phosphotransferase enzyme family protein n=1 Tax=Mucilaginibacter sp. BT774 TaxID=3062276 RepID=UPI0026755118|nr:aminoglycoside phosphotransferase family protein [Mucilaginibacter sp. BT774]MDO3627529.1 aminoglycoside phosphotransferase family protein [Mucilaginibacter sp. BT774]
MKNIENIAAILAQFKCKADERSVRAYGSGHINDTYFLKGRDRAHTDYLLQRINHNVFRDVEKLSENTCFVINHLKNKVKNNGKGDAEKEVVTLVPTTGGKYFFKDQYGNFWRMCYFLVNTKSYDVVQTAKQAYEGGKAFGRFHAMLSDVSPHAIYDVIPNFHNVQIRLEQLASAVFFDNCGRAILVEEELIAIKKYAQFMQYFQQPKQLLSLPKRVIHNDAKFNNVLLSQNDESQCVIDLDTVMAGYVAFDFGDAIRTIINKAPEDEADINKIGLNIPLFAAYTEGYFHEAGAFLTSNEIDSLLMGVLLFPYMQAVRFLADHINGDKYYKTEFEGHNLQRARAQFNLFEKLYSNQQLLQDIITEKSGMLKLGVSN